MLGFGFEEEVERIDGRHVGHEIDRDVEMRDALGEHHAGEVVALRVLLPVDEVRLGFDDQRIGQDRRAGVRRRAQADGLRAERDQPVVAVGRAMGQRDGKGHLIGFAGSRVGPARNHTAAVCAVQQGLRARSHRLASRAGRDANGTEPPDMVEFCGSPHGNARNCVSNGGLNGPVVALTAC